MSIWSSRDEARTWSAPKLVYEQGPSAYSDMTRLTDGRMGLLFEKGVASV
ncbi:MAG: sialidase family protein [Kiritimatiellia bacterium]